MKMVLGFLIGAHWAFWMARLAAMDIDAKLVALWAFPGVLVHGLLAFLIYVNMEEK